MAYNILYPGFHVQDTMQSAHVTCEKFLPSLILINHTYQF